MIFALTKKRLRGLELALKLLISKAFILKMFIVKFLAKDILRTQDLCLSFNVHRRQPRGHGRVGGQPAAGPAGQSAEGCLRPKMEAASFMLGPKKIKMLLQK